MKHFSSSGAVWGGMVFLIIFSPLIQGGTPRLPVLIIELTILLLLTLWSLDWGWRAPRQELRLTILDGLLCLFLFCGVFSLLFAPYYHSAERALLQFLLMVMLYWVLVSHPRLTGVERVLTAVVLQGLFQACLVWLQVFAGAAVRPAGTFYNPNFMSGYLAGVSALALGRALFPAGRRRLLVAGYLGAFVLIAGAVILSGSRGGALAFAAGTIVLLLWRRPLLALGCGAAATAALALIPNPLRDRVVNLPDLDVFAYTRLSIWRSGFEMIRDHPLFGVGIGQYRYFSHQYAFPVEAHWARFSRVAENPHSEYLLTGAELGVAALIIVLVAVGLGAVWIIRHVRRTPVRERGATAPYAAALAALLAHAAVDFNLQIPPTALLFVFAAAAIRINGVEGPYRVVELRFRKVYAVAAAILALVLAGVAFRPVAGFWFFLKGIGSPPDLLREMWALEEAPKEPPPFEEALRDLRLAATIDFPCASYHNALGSRYFQAYLRDPSDSGSLLEKGLYHAQLAAHLNPVNHRYALGLAQAMTSLYRGVAPDERYLREAVSYYRHAMELAPNYYFIAEELGLLLDRLAEDAAAGEQLRRAVALEPDYLRGWFNLGTYHARHGRMAEARKAFERGRAAAAQDREATNAYERSLIDFDGALFENSLRELTAREMNGGA